jgi:mRNA-degrading endonuclease RelE of RelBE toxin-antitoxin system
MLKKLDLKFNLIPTKYFIKQFSKLNEKEKNLINSKLEILKTNPFKFKKLSGFKNTFEVKITIKNSYSRLIYVVFSPK